jgi:hypothetical protein
MKSFLCWDLLRVSVIIYFQEELIVLYLGRTIIMTFTIEKHFKIYDHAAWQVIKESINIFKLIFDNVTDKNALKRTVESSKFLLVSCLLFFQTLIFKLNHSNSKSTIELMTNLFKARRGG